MESGKHQRRSIPIDIISDILERVPVKPLVRFTTVAKSWYELIKSPDFIKRHSKRAIASYEKTNETSYLLMLKYFRGLDQMCSVFTDNSEFVQVGEFTFPFDYDIKVVSSLDGLVCLTHDDLEKFGRVIYVWNPAISKVKIVKGSSFEGTDDEDTLTHVGFGYDRLKEDYKLVRVIYYAKPHPNKSERTIHPDPPVAEVYSFNTGTWRQLNVDITCFIEYHKMPIFLNGCVNWLAAECEEWRDDLVLSFNLQSEEFTQVDLPNFRAMWDAEDPYLLTVDGKLAIFVMKDQGIKGSKRWCVWVLQRFGDEDSWIKKHVVQTPRAIEYYTGYTKNSQIMLRSLPRGIVSYDFATRRMVDVGVHNCVNTYMESLLLLDHNNELTDEAISDSSTEVDSEQSQGNGDEPTEAI